MNPPAAASAVSIDPVAAISGDKSPAAPAYRRVLLKLSGEALMGDDQYGIKREVIDRIVAEIGENGAVPRRRTRQQDLITP